MKRFAILTFVGASLISCTTKSERPNVVVFLADDAGYADFSFAENSTMQTPNLDKMVEKGVLLTDMHTSGSVSGPSRCGLMTGRYQQRFGCETNDSAEVGVPLEEKFMSEYFKDLGYATAAFGKWHLGPSDELHPNSRGFDEFYGFLGGHRDYFYSDADLKSDTKAIQHNGEKIPFEGYLTDVLGGKAIDFIDKNKENPFFIYLAYNAVHTPLQATDEDMSRFEGHPRQTVAAMTWALDRSIGSVMDKLEKEGLIDNTLVLFLSDNGGDTPKCNLPLKSHKGTEFEGGHRVPCIMQWNGVIPAGVKFDGLSSSLDFLPTFMTAAGSKPEYKNAIDGVNLLPYLKGDCSGNPHEWLFWRVERWHGARYNDYKYVYAEGVGDRLYNLADDLGETVDLRSSNDAIYQEMKDALLKWGNSMKEPIKKGDAKWKEVKAYMYDELFNNREPRISYPGQLDQLKAEQKARSKNGVKN